MGEKRGRTNQISKTIQFLPHQTTLLPPPCHLAVHEVEEQAGGYEGESDVDVCVGAGRVEAVAEGGEDGHEAAEACH